MESRDSSPLRYAGAFQLSKLPGKGSSDGWKPGSGAKVSQTLLGLSLASEYRGEGRRLGIWTSGSCGFFARPNLAASIHADSGYLVLGEAGQGRPEGRIFCFAYGAGKGFLDIEGKNPVRDRVLEAGIDLRGEAWSVGLGLVSYSKNSESGTTIGTELPKPGISQLDLLLWRWRTDLLNASLTARMGSFHASVKATTDSEGLASGLATLKIDLAQPAAGGGLSLGCDLKLGRNGASETVDDEESDEETDPEAGSGSLYVKRIGVGLRVGWPRSAGRGFLSPGSVSLSFLALRGEAGWEPALDFNIAAGLRIGDLFSLTLSANTPSGGYSLTKLPDILPDLSLGFSLGKALR